MIVENRPGAGGNLASDVLAKSPPDGYTVLQTVNGIAISPSLYKVLPFDSQKDFRRHPARPVATHSSSPIPSSRPTMCGS